MGEVSCPKHFPSRSLNAAFVGLRTTSDILVGVSLNLQQEPEQAVHPPLHSTTYGFPHLLRWHTQTIHTEKHNTFHRWLRNPWMYFVCSTFMSRMVYDTQCLSGYLPEQTSQNLGIAVLLCCDSWNKLTNCCHCGVFYFKKVYTALISRLSAFQRYKFCQTWF